MVKCGGRVSVKKAGFIVGSKERIKVASRPSEVAVEVESKYIRNRSNRSYESRITSSEEADDSQRIAQQLKEAKSISAIDSLLHNPLVQKNAYLGNTLVRAYARCGCIDKARAAFNEIHNKNVYSWTIIISVYAQTGHSNQAIELFCRMEQDGVKPNEVTFTAVLTACSSAKDLVLGKRLHLRIQSDCNQDTMLGNALLNMYSKCGSLKEARECFDSMKTRDVATWTTMITACSEHCQYLQAIELFWDMMGSDIEPNEITCMAVLGACSNVGDLNSTRLVHRRIASLESKPVVGNCLVYAYGQCGGPDDARVVFDKILSKNIVSWTSMMVAYVQNGRAEEGLNLYSCIPESVKLDEVTYLVVLEACAITGSLQVGREIHQKCLRSSLHVALGTAVVNMYGKCGSLREAKAVFDGMPVRNTVTWNAIMAAYTQHGRAEEALELFHMSSLEGVSADGVTMVTVLFSCSHVGLVEQGACWFGSMRNDYGVDPALDHYVCVVDLLGRAGWLEDAECVVRSTPSCRLAFAPWMTLLAACKVHAAVERAAVLCAELASLEPEHCAPLVMLSNVYAAQDEDW